jgi:hypothetical protein
MFNHPITTLLPSREINTNDDYKQQLVEETERIYNKVDPKKQELKPLNPGQNVMIFDKYRKTWSPGFIVSKCEQPRSYMVETPNGHILRRNRNHLKELNVPPTPYTAVHPKEVKKCVSFADNHDGNANTDKTRSSTDTNTSRTRSGRIIRRPAKYSE